MPDHSDSLVCEMSAICNQHSQMFNEWFPFKESENVLNNTQKKVSWTCILSYCFPIAPSHPQPPFFCLLCTHTFKYGEYILFTKWLTDECNSLCPIQLSCLTWFLLRRKAGKLSELEIIYICLLLLCFAMNLPSPKSFCYLKAYITGCPSIRDELSTTRNHFNCCFPKMCTSISKKTLGQFSFSVSQFAVLLL